MVTIPLIPVKVERIGSAPEEVKIDPPKEVNVRVEVGVSLMNTVLGTSTCSIIVPSPLVIYSVVGAALPLTMVIDAIAKFL